MDIEVMQAESAINEFIDTFIGMVADSQFGVSQNDVQEFRAMLEVCKTVHLAQLSIKKMLGALGDKRDGEST